jgi:predicted nucleotidyltransferase
MHRDTVLAIIRKHRSELERLGVESLSLFGSTARGEAGTSSDVDIAVKLAQPEPAGFEYFGRLATIRQRLSTMLAADVDVVHEPAARPHLQSEIEKDRALAY